MGVTLFGGFTDEFLRVDEFTGRVDRLPVQGTTLLFPWEGRQFVVLENVLGRRSQVRLSLRDLIEPGESIAEVISAELPAAAGPEWGRRRRKIPGLYPTAYRIGGGVIEEVALDDATAGGAFVAGVFAEEVPVVVDGHYAGLEVSAAVGRDEQLWIANEDGLAWGGDGRIVAAPDRGRWRPQAIEHDSATDRVVVASWNRFRAQGGPSTDLYVFDARGRCEAVGRVDALVDRMALHGNHVTAHDVTGNVASSVVSVA